LQAIACRKMIPGSAGPLRHGERSFDGQDSSFCLRSSNSAVSISPRA